jgi:cyanocobalamin reductase (cyanide-eliminating) / alkylcobalamin dealkylase
MKRERTPAPWQSVVDEVGSRCAAAGLDLVQPFQVTWYDGVVVDAFRLPDLGRPSALGVLVGNTRALWPRFLAALRADARALDESHPLDTYVRAAVLGALEPLAHRWEARFSFEPPPRRVAMQRLAHVSGLAYLSPSHLSVHVTYGPWIALRAAVVIDIEGPSGPSPDPPNPCPDCESHCLPRFRDAIAEACATPAGYAAIERYWRLWLAVRDACPVGRSHRYSDEQIRYHYTKDRDVLSRMHGSSGP